MRGLRPRSYCVPLQLNSGVRLHRASRMVEFREADFAPLDDFPLLWRWTSPSHAQLPAEVLREIRPLTAAAASAIAPEAARSRRSRDRHYASSPPSLPAPRCCSFDVRWRSRWLAPSPLRSSSRRWPLAPAGPTLRSEAVPACRSPRSDAVAWSRVPSPRRSDAARAPDRRRPNIELKLTKGLLIAAAAQPHFTWSLCSLTRALGGNRVLVSRPFAL